VVTAQSSEYSAGRPTIAVTIRDSAGRTVYSVLTSALAAGSVVIH